MYTPRLTHVKIKEMIGQENADAIPVSVHELAVEMGMNRDIIVEHVVVLKALGLVIFTDEEKEFISLTDKGRITRL